MFKLLQNIPLLCEGVQVHVEVLHGGVLLPVQLVVRRQPAPDLLS